MKRIFLLFSVCCFSVQLVSGQSEAGKPDMQWWQGARFGLFLHWGLYAVAAGDWNGHRYKGNEHFMLYEKIPWKVYGQTLASKFDPRKFNADAWVKMAKDAGMKYIVITAKHHDGFAMYNSPSSDYNIVKMTPWGKDPMKMLAAACRKEGIRLCFYYSLGRDWQDPDVPTNWPVKGGRSNTWDYPDEDAKVFARYFERKVKPQIKELLTQYGPVGVLWFDTPELISKQESEELKELVHRLQPDCIVNNRIGNGSGDYNVLEQSINNKINLHPWESCVTISGGWGYNKYDTAWKSPDLLIRQLIETVSAGGNYLLNLSPMGNGDFAMPAKERLKSIGAWMKINGEAIYDSHPYKVAGEKVYATDAQNTDGANKAAPANTMTDALNDKTSRKIFPEIRFTSKGDALYVFAADIKDKKISLASLSRPAFRQVRTISLLGSAKQVHWQQNDTSLTIEMPEVTTKDIHVLVFKVE